MADIKFMDISENDNPATTDSILVGNQDNGVKRTTLGKIGDMFAIHNLIHTETVTVNMKAIHLLSGYLHLRLEKFCQRILIIQLVQMQISIL